MTLSARDRRVLVAGLGACAAIGVLGRGWPWAREHYRDALSNAADLERRVAAAQAAIASGPVVARVAVERRAALDSLQVRLFSAITSNGAAAAVSAHVARVAHAAKVELTSVQILTDTARSTSAFRRVRVSLSARGDVRGLARLLAAFDDGERMCRVLSLSVAQTEVIGRADAPEILNLQMNIEALAAVVGAR